MKQVLIKGGGAVVDDISSPKNEKDTVLVEVSYSCISTGTEMSGVKESGKSLARRLIENPQNIIRGLIMVKNEGFKRTMDIANGVLNAGYPVGYSAAGKIIEVGENIKNISKGDIVACAGAGIANHAEIIKVPENLCVKVPEGVNLKEASTVTLGAIAMQGVRRANPTLGETFVVIGLGILGQITVELLRANGCKVIGVDLDRERLAIAEKIDGVEAISPDEDDSIKLVEKITNGYGADGVIVTAATPSNEVMSSAFNMCRRKGRVVLVGDVGLDLKRGDFYRKEIDFFISTSYGPGRYDNNYELHGMDYPIGYVRWTENRNMEEFLNLIKEKKVNVETLISKVYDITDATKAYEDISNSEDKPLITLLGYENERSLEEKLIKRTNIEVDKNFKGKQINLGLAGAGGFLSGMHLPNIKKLEKKYSIHSIMSRTGSSANALAKQYSAKYATTDFSQMTDDEEIDAVIISTRHNSHWQMAKEALQKGKHVFLEKPLCINEEELNDVKKFFKEEKPKAILFTGFNRRFSPYLKKAKEITEKRVNPLIVNYTMNAGFIPYDHWVHGEEGGGRNIGEGCHIYDIFNFLTDSKVESIHASGVNEKEGLHSNDNFVATIKYEDGSVCNLVYTALGNSKSAKEKMEVFVDGKIIKLDDYNKMEVIGLKNSDISTQMTDKGHLEELEIFYKAIKEGFEPIELWQQIQATEISFEVEKQLKGK